MISDQYVELEGIGYRWVYCPNDEVPWEWCQPNNRPVTCERTCKKLNDLLLAQRLGSMVHALDSAAEARQLERVVIAMNAPAAVVDFVARRDFEALGFAIPAPNLVHTQTRHYSGRGTTPFDDVVLRNWLLLDGKSLSRFTHVATIGSGPFDRHEFNQFLNAHGVEATLIDGDTTVIVGGRRDWDRDDVLALGNRRQKKRCHIYSQEMYLLQMFMPGDLFEEGTLPDDVLARFRQSHELIEFVETNWDGWDRACLVPKGTRDHYRGRVPKVGFLRFLGYEVGRTGVPRAERQELLNRAVREEVPHIYDREHRDEWGMPDSSQRLKKVVGCLVGFIEPKHASRYDNSKACDDWQDDLAWFRSRYNCR